MALFFSDTAVRLAGLAGLLLGWRPHEFWAATPGELAGIFSAAIGDEAEGGVPDAATIAKLQEMYPDG